MHESYKKMESILSTEYYLQTTDMCHIMKKHGSDKGLGYHNYTTLYHSLFSSLRDQQVNILEVGLGTNNPNIPSNMGVNGRPGASLRGWEEYFTHPDTKIVGLDIDKDILFQTNKIKTFYCDQTNATSIDTVWNSIPEISEFDIIVDDGLHTYEAGISFLENSMHKLKKGGIYIVEDLLPDTQFKFQVNLEGLKDKYELSHVSIVTIPHTANNIDNCVLLIKK